MSTPNSSLNSCFHYSHIGQGQHSRLPDERISAVLSVVEGHFRYPSLFLIFGFSRVTRVLYQLMRFTENVIVFAQLSLQLFLNNPLLTCPVNESRAGKSCSAGAPWELCSCDLTSIHSVHYKKVYKVKVGVKQPCQRNYICCLEDDCPLQSVQRTASCQKLKTMRGASLRFCWDLLSSTSLFPEALRLAALFLGSALAVHLPDKIQQQFLPTCSINPLLVS